MKSEMFVLASCFWGELCSCFLRYHMCLCVVFMCPLHVLYDFFTFPCLIQSGRKMLSDLFNTFILTGFAKPSLACPKLDLEPLARPTFSLCIVYMCVMFSLDPLQCVLQVCFAHPTQQQQPRSNVHNYIYI